MHSVPDALESQMIACGVALMDYDYGQAARRISKCDLD